MRGGACSEDTGEDGKEDRQFHMQKRKKKDTFSKETFTKSVSSETLLLSVTVVVVSATHITRPSPYMSQLSAMKSSICVLMAYWQSC